LSSAAFFDFNTLQRKNNWSIIDLYISGKLPSSVRKELPPLNTPGYANPTYVGSNAIGEQPFLGPLSRPIILNERVVPDDKSATGNGISDVPATCSPAIAYWS